MYFKEEKVVAKETWTQHACVLQTNISIVLSSFSRTSSNKLTLSFCWQLRTSRPARRDQRACEQDSYLDEFGWGEDGLVGHSGRRHYNGGVVFLLQPLIEHLHVEESQEAEPAGAQGGSQVNRGFITDIHVFVYRESGWKEFKLGTSERCISIIWPNTTWDDK